ncbi:MAG: DUF1697 domain-containing protein [Chloroflexota bacterium]|nr:DUF1697 domain-containing protein [Chloroflexota bacterium]
MSVQVALLRAINVGGTTKLAMADLRHMLSAIGFNDAKTLLQTGNVVLTSEAVTGLELERLLESEVERRLGLRTDVMVRSAPDWSDLVENNPFPDAATNDPAHLVVMFLKQAPAPEAVDLLREAIRGPEIVSAVDRELYVIYPDGIGRSKVTTKVIESTLRTRGTGRNWNTVLKLATLVAG